jgi:hypothetical protein
MTVTIKRCCIQRHKLKIMSSKQLLTKDIQTKGVTYHENHLGVTVCSNIWCFSCEIIWKLKVTEACRRGFREGERIGNARDATMFQPKILANFFLGRVSRCPG